MIKKILVTTILCCMLFTSCKGSETTYTIELSQKDMLVALAGKNCADENFVYTLQKAVSLQEKSSDKTLLEQFYDVWKNEKYEIKLITVFDFVKNYDIDEETPNSIAWDIVKREVENYVFYVPNVIKSRLKNAGCHVIENENYDRYRSYSMDGYYFNIVLKNVQNQDRVKKLITTKGVFSILGKDGNILGGEYITQAKYNRNSNNNYQICLEFNTEGQQILAGIIKNNIGSQLIISLDNQIIDSQNITERIANGKFCFSTNRSKEEIEDLAVILNSGSMVICCKITEQNTKQ